MQELESAAPVTALFADADPGQRRAIKIYGATQTMVTTCAVMASSDQVLARLQAGLRPQVLVLDALLQSPNIFALLPQIGMVAVDYQPAIIATYTAPGHAVAEKLLTSGANYTILKPYRLNELYENVVLWGTGDRDLAARRVRMLLDARLSALHASRRIGGLSYLEQIISYMVLEKRDFTAAELYQRVAQTECVTPGAITSALNRINEDLWRADTPAYRALCRGNGKPEGTRLTNTELLRGLACEVRRALRW